MEHTEFANELFDAPLDEEMRKSYLEYAMSVIVGRALPDARDGLKPVHRRVLHSMNELDNLWNKAYKKSARVVGDTIGKYHPHGDTAVYDAIVRLAQDFSLRYPLVDGQGNFGSIDGDSAAAMRYTEIRLEKISSYLLADIDKETVDFVPNYDGSELEPSVLPTTLPNLLLNGSEGIAVGMATKIAPHNLKELLAACVELLKNPAVSVDDLMRHVPAPDFPTGGLILGLDGARQCYRTGSGSIVIRSKTHFEETDSGRQAIVVDELPYQVNKKTLQEKIASLVQEKEIEGISNIQDESDKDGIRLVIELKKNEIPEVVLNQLFKKTQLQTSFGSNMVALVNGRPEVLNLKTALSVFLAHRREVMVRKTLFELRAAKRKGHILEGYALAVANMNEVVELIRASSSAEIAKSKLLEKRWGAGVIEELLSKGALSSGEPCIAGESAHQDYGLTAQGYRLSEDQVKAILDLKLQRLTGMEQSKIIEDYRQVLDTILDLEDLAQNDVRITNEMIADFELMSHQFGDARRSQIVFNAGNIDDEDLIPRKELVISFTKVGYIKAQALDDYEAQNRGGKGRSATDMKNEDMVSQMIGANSHDTLLCFTNMGKVFSIKGYALPEGGRNARGRPLNNFLNLSEKETVVQIMPLKKEQAECSILTVTKHGFIKKTPIENFKNMRSSGLIAMHLEDGDDLVGTQIVKDSEDVLVFSSANRAIRFAAQDLRDLSRTAKGVKCMKRDNKEIIVSMLKASNDNATILVVTENGYAKKINVMDFRKTKRTAAGVRPFPESQHLGPLIKAIEVKEEQDVVVITNKGTLLRSPGNQIRALSRSAQGSRLVRIDGEEKVSDVIAVEMQKMELLEASDASDVSSLEQGDVL